MLLLSYLNNPLEFIFLLIALIVAITFHEFAHAAAAVFLGDITPKLEGRLSLNPLKHLDPYGTLILVMTGFIGFGKPVPFNPHFVKHGKWGTAMVGIVGPLTNFFIAFIFILFAKTVTVPLISLQIFEKIISINVLLGVFNLIPIPPLDGSRLLQAVLPESQQGLINTLEKNNLGIKIIFTIVIIDVFFLNSFILSKTLLPMYEFVLKILNF